MKATVTLHKDFIVGEIDERLYGSFIEHMGRAIYTGVYEPEHPDADEEGFREDVLELVRELELPQVRYPGGNFLSAYNWEDGIGPKKDRPVRLDLAWRTRETNQVGINEFASWAQKANTQIMLAVNLGSRDMDAARNLLEYCNHPGGTYWSDLRRRHGVADPHNIKLWCLGNEMDGPWQIGRKGAAEYGKLANETAKAMKAYDPSIETIVCGSSNSMMETYPQWEITVLEESFENVDYISLHQYFDNKEGDTLNFFGKLQQLDQYIRTISAVIDVVKAAKRSEHDVYISFDEWNVWYHNIDADMENCRIWDWPTAPALLEETYNFEDALLVGGILNTLIRRSDRVKIGCMAQLVNVIAPIRADAGGAAFRQTIYYPFLFASKYGRGTALRTVCNCPIYDCDAAEKVPYLDIAAVQDKEANVITLFAINRHAAEAMDVDIRLEGFMNLSIMAHKTMADFEIGAVNSSENQLNVAPVDGAGLQADKHGGLIGRLAPFSYHMIRVAYDPG